MINDVQQEVLMILKCPFCEVPASCLPSIAGRVLGTRETFGRSVLLHIHLCVYNKPCTQCWERHSHQNTPAKGNSAWSLLCWLQYCHRCWCQPPRDIPSLDPSFPASFEHWDFIFIFSISSLLCLGLEAFLTSPEPCDFHSTPFSSSPSMTFQSKHPQHS